MTSAPVDLISAAIDQFEEMVVQLRADVTVASAEKLCMEGRTAYAALFPDWRELREHHSELLDRFVRLLRDAHLEIKKVAAPDSYEDVEALAHCASSTDCRTRSVEILIKEGDPKKAVDVLEELMSYP